MSALPRVLRLSLFAVIGALLSACGGPTPQPGEASAELGTGEWRFESLVDEQELTLVYGSQGGQHVWASLRTEGIAAERVSLEVVTELADFSLPPERSTVRVLLDRDPETGGAMIVGWPAVISDPSAVVGRLMRLRMEVTDSTGARASDERFIIPVAPPIESIPDGTPTR